MTDQVNADKVTLNYPGGTAEFPILPSAAGDDVIDFSKLNAATGLNAFDQGFVNTASTKSAITYIDGDEGILRYRGYPIEELAGQKTFLEVAFLLIYGELPSESQLADFDGRIRRHTLIHEELKNIFHAMPQNAHPMSVLAAGASALSTFYQDSLDPHDEEQVELSSIRMLAKMPVLAPMSQKVLPAGIVSMKSNSSGSIYSWPSACQSKRCDGARNRSRLPRSSVS